MPTLHYMHCIAHLHTLHIDIYVPTHTHGEVLVERDGGREGSYLCTLHTDR